MAWHIDFPAELAGRPDLRFTGDLSGYWRSEDQNRKTIIALTTGGQLAQIWDEASWHIDFPAEHAGHGGLAFVGTPAVFPRNRGDNTKNIYAVTSDGRLAQLFDGHSWTLDFPAELAGHDALKFKPSPAAYSSNPSSNKKVICAVTTTGRLVQLWDTHNWNLDFPAELAGHPGLQFRGAPAMIDQGSNKVISALTQEGRLVELLDWSSGWKVEFLAEKAGVFDPLIGPARVISGRKHFVLNAAHKLAVVGVFDDVTYPIDAPFIHCPSNGDPNDDQGTAVVGLAVDNRLVIARPGWPGDYVYPADEAGEPSLRFIGGPTMTRDAFSSLGSILAVTTDGRLAQLFQT